MNLISSFGFSEKWRRQFINEIKIKEDSVIVDLMTGMGECWKFILKNASGNSKLISLDFSTEMIIRAKNNAEKYTNDNIEILHENVFENSIIENSVDYVFSGFGLKTFNDKQLSDLAKEIKRMLKRNGEFSLIDVSVPQNKVLIFFYMFYLKKIIPLLGKLFIGNPETYRMLGCYTQEFKNSKNVQEIFQKEGFQVKYVEYFYGCVTGIKGINIK